MQWKQLKPQWKRMKTQLGCSGLLQVALGSSGLLWGALGCSVLLWAGLGRIGSEPQIRIYRRVKLCLKFDPQVPKPFFKKHVTSSRPKILRLQLKVSIEKKPQVALGNLRLLISFFEKNPQVGLRLALKNIFQMSIFFSAIQYVK